MTPTFDPSARHSADQHSDDQHSDDQRNDDQHGDDQRNDVDRKLIAGLERLAQAFRVLLWNEAKANGLSPIQLQILVHLEQQPAALPMVSALARKFDLTKATISDAVKALEQKRLLTRSPDPHDARSRRLELTPAGADLAEKVAGWADSAHLAVAQFSASDKNALLLGLMELIAKLHEAGVITVARMCSTCRFLDRGRPDAAFFCTLLDKPLEVEELRLDCLEHQAA